MRALLSTTLLLLALFLGWTVMGLWVGRDALAQGPAGLGPQSLEIAFPNLSFRRMVGLTHADDGMDRLWAVLQDGRIMVFPNDPQVMQAGLFLDIQGRVNGSGNEEGLLGLAFDPDYRSNGHFYVSYTAAGPRRSVISRFSVSGDDSNKADSTSELVLLEVPQPYSNHNGGSVTFGLDGYLYIALGDGGSGGDPLGSGQDTSTLLGAILRIDVGEATPGAPYRIPPDNPLVGMGSARPEIWAYGLRNPWKFSFDPASGDLWAADVGQNDYEEVDIIRRGGNYGWNVMEGAHCYPQSVQTCDQSGLEMPVTEYGHDLGCSITGGYVYRGSKLPELVGAYLYADFCSGRIWALRYDGTAVTETALLADTSLQVPSFGVDEVGEVYVLAFDDRIYRFVPPEPAPTATPAPTVTPALIPTPMPTATPTATPEPAPPSSGDIVLPDWSGLVLAMLGVAALVLSGGLLLSRGKGR